MADEEQTESNEVTEALVIGILKKALPLIVSAILGAVSGSASRQVTDANHVANDAQTRDVAFAAGAAVTKEREARQADIEARRKLRDAQIRALEDRLLVLETKLQNIHYPLEAR